MSPKLKNWLIIGHRWAALALAPVFLLIILSGAVLAFKPMLEDASGPPAAVPVGQVLATLAAADPAGKAKQLRLADDGRTVSIATPDGNAASFDLATHARTAGEPASGFDVFAFAKDVHKNLLIGAGELVEIAAYAMLAIILSGLLFGWPKLRNTLIGWHLGIGWLALPLVLLTPLTAVLMVLHVGDAPLPHLRPGKPIPLARAIETASTQANLEGLVSARRFRGGSVLIETRGASGEQRYMVGSDGSFTKLQGGPGLVHELHEGTWAGALSGAINLASALVLGGLLGTGMYAWWRRRAQASRRSGDRDADILVAFASQTGTAARLAEATAAALRQAGQRVACAALGTVAPAELAGFRQTLLIASTTGDGQVPDPALGFLQRTTNADLRGARFGLLALGDSRYRAFCGGGATLRQALLDRGAQENLPWQRVDGAPGPGWRTWLASVGALLGVDTGTPDAPVQDVALELRLASRQRLDDAADPELRETWSLMFDIEAGSADFRPGDLLLVSPAPGEPERCYSIGSDARDKRQIGLTVGFHRWRDAEGREHPGRASDLLCHGLTEGGVLKARLRRHPEFNPPEDMQRPIIMVAAGAGIAPFPGFIARRPAGAAPAWLLFGNRRRAGDFFYRGLFETALREGRLARLDTAFSRDGNGGGYIHQRILENGAEILDWLAGRRGILYTCGRASTVGKSVEAALHDIVARHGGKYGLTDPEATLARWRADGTLRVDMFG